MIPGILGQVGTVAAVPAVPPVITSTDTAAVLEGAMLGKSLTADQTVTWSIVGGVDAAQFELSGAFLRWLSNGVKDYELPDDDNNDNAYVVIVRAASAGGTDDQTITVTVADVAAPTITSSNTATVNEGATLAKVLAADQTVAWSIVGGINAVDFEISGSTLRWVGNGVKNYGPSNDYIVIVRATGADGTADQTIAVSVADVPPPTITSSAAVSVDEGVTLAHSLTANQSVAWFIVGGADAAEFEISGSTLRWVGNGTQEVGTETDYTVIVRATNAVTGDSTDQTITVTVAAVVVADDHRYWRVFCETNNGDASFIGIGELEMYETPYAGPNVLTGGTISASSVSSGFEASKAIDGTYHTGTGSGAWTSNTTGGTDEWLKYDFGSGVTKWITSVGICAVSTTSEHDRTAKDIRIEWSDDNSAWTTYWTDSLTYTRILEYQRSMHSDFIPSYSGSPYGTHTYWRILILSANTSSVSAAEVEMRATTGGADQCSGGTPTVSSTLVGTAASIFDDNNSTHWAINMSGAAWIKYQFASPVTVGQIAYRIRGDSNPTHSPNDFMIQFSDDNVKWATAWMQFDEASWTNGEQRVFTSPDYV